MAVLIQMGLIVGGLVLGLKINGAKYSDSIREIVSNLNYKVLGVGLAFTFNRIRNVYVYVCGICIASK